MSKQQGEIGQKTTAGNGHAGAAAHGADHAGEVDPAFFAGLSWGGEVHSANIALMNAVQAQQSAQIIANATVAAGVVGILGASKDSVFGEPSKASKPESKQEPKRASEKKDG